MRETSKAYKLLVNDPLWKQIPKGNWLDVGAGDDCLPGARPFDKQHGDAHSLEGIPAESQDLVFSSHCLEHLERPKDAIRRWLEVLKPKGWLWVIVPDFNLYEHAQWPSKFNPDHKHAFMPNYSADNFKNVIYLIDLATEFHNIADTYITGYRCAGYDFSRIKELTDQTLGDAEASCELVMRKI